MLTAQDVHILDINAAYYGTPTHQLMENAGNAVATYLHKNTTFDKKNILILCGIGNNGGDGFVAARHLAKHYPTTVFLLATATRLPNYHAEKSAWTPPSSSARSGPIESHSIHLLRVE